MHFCWTTISVKNMDRSLSFYQDIVGLKLNRRVKASEDVELAFLGEGETQVELISIAGKDLINIGDDISLGFIVESISQLTEFLQSKGIKIHSGPFQPNPYIRFLFIQDPDGLRIQFVENVKP